MLSKDLEQTLNDAFRSARAKRHEFMTVEHLLLALLDNNDAIRALKACGADIGCLREEIDELVDPSTTLGSGLIQLEPSGLFFTFFTPFEWAIFTLFPSPYPTFSSKASTTWFSPVQFGRNFRFFPVL